MRLVAIAAAVVATLAYVAPAEASPASATPVLLGTPSARYRLLSDRHGTYVSVLVVFRTRQALDRTVFTTVAAPALRRGQKLPGELFAGVTPTSIGARAKHCYTTEASQLRRRRKITDRTWQFALSRQGSTVSGTPKHVTLSKASWRTAWQRAAANRLGC